MGQRPSMSIVDIEKHPAKEFKWTRIFIKNFLTLFLKYALMLVKYGDDWRKHPEGSKNIGSIMKKIYWKIYRISQVPEYDYLAIERIAKKLRDKLVDGDRCRICGYRLKKDNVLSMYCHYRGKHKKYVEFELSNIAVEEYIYLLERNGVLSSIPS